MTTVTTPGQVTARVLGALKGHSMRSARSIQQAEHRVGASEIGLCRSYLKFMTLGTPYDEERNDDIKWQAFVGSAVGDRVEDAYISEHPTALKQQSYDCTLPSGKVIACNPDIVDPEEDILIDCKTKNGTALVAAAGKPTQQYRYQVLIYLRGAIQSGLLTPNAKAFLVYFDRSGDEEIPVTLEVVADKYVYDEIDSWIDDANFAVINDVEAPKDQEWQFCENYCRFFTTCRAGDAFAEGLIEDEDAKLALKVHLEAKSDASAATKRKKDADAVLKAIAAKGGGRVMTDEGIYEVSSTWINGSAVAYERSGYDRLNVRKQRPVKKDKAEKAEVEA